MPRRNQVAVLLLGTFFVTVLAMNAILFYAGTVGDTKTGLRGNPFRALELENYALYLLIPSSVLLGSGVFFLPGKSSANNLLFAIMATLLSLPLLWFLGIMVEGWGVIYAA